MLRCALLTTAFAMTVGGVWGLHAFYEETCSKHGACPVEEITMAANVLSPGVVAVMMVAFMGTFFDKQKKP